MGLMAAILALFARKALGRSALLVFIGASPLMPCKTGLNEAHAYTYATTFDLVFPSPTISPELRIYQNISVTNLTGQTIRIDSVSADWSYLTAPTQTPRCQPGLILSQAEVLLHSACIYAVASTGDCLGATQQLSEVAFYCGLLCNFS